MAGMDSKTPPSGAASAPPLKDPASSGRPDGQSPTIEFLGHPRVLEDLRRFRQGLQVVIDAVRAPQPQPLGLLDRLLIRWRGGDRG